MKEIEHALDKVIVVWREVRKAKTTSEEAVALAAFDLALKKVSLEIGKTQRKLLRRLTGARQPS